MSTILEDIFKKNNNDNKVFNLNNTFFKSFMNASSIIKLIDIRKLYLDIIKYEQNKEKDVKVRSSLKKELDILYKKKNIKCQKLLFGTDESYHPGRCANLKIGKDVIATLGEVHPEVLDNYEISRRVYIAEVNITKLVKYSRENKKYVEVPKFPAVERDIAIIVDEEVEVGQIEKIITKKGKKLLESMKLLDKYRNEKLRENKKSVAYSLIFRDKNKTLNDEEINVTMENIIAELEKTLGAELRK